MKKLLNFSKRKTNLEVRLGEVEKLFLVSGIENLFTNYVYIAVFPFPFIPIGFFRIWTYFFC